MVNSVWERETRRPRDRYDSVFYNQYHEAKRRGYMTQNQSQRDKAKTRLDVEADKVARKFIDAALGRREFKELDKKTRAALLVKAMEWSIGRPNTGRSIIEDPVDEEETGIEFTS